jgi:hypothetical protein
MEVHCVKEGVLVVAVNGAHRSHCVIDRLAADDLSEQAREALCCRCSPDGERERDDICGKDRAVIDDRSSESCALARGEHEESAAIRSAQRDELRRSKIPVIPHGKVVFALEVVVVPVSRDDDDMRPEGVDRYLQASR